MIHITVTVIIYIVVTNLYNFSSQHYFSVYLVRFFCFIYFIFSYFTISIFSICFLLIVHFLFSIFF